MDKHVLDQAEGLRRLLARDAPRVVTLVGGDEQAGTSSAVINLAAALARQGKDVLVIDEQCDAKSLVEAVGADRARTLSDVVAGNATIEEISAQFDERVRVIASPLGTLAGCSPTQTLASLNCGVDVVLIDAKVDDEGALSPIAMQAHDVVVVMRANAQSITGAYACVKRLHFAHAIHQFRVLINGVTSASDAYSVYQNLTAVGSRYLAVSFSPAGAVSLDVRLARAALLNRTVVEAFPAAPATLDFRRIAVDLLHWPWRPAVQAPARGMTSRAAHAPLASTV
ncbi:MinD/ParA family protein [Pararobbsia alpina]|uniref:MinD/ParA family ATP-binding protein n=1 Tax=Pararobbsia alpina TaxID=621374 RepID=UPI0039A43A04